MANKKLHSLSDVLELRLHQPITRENVWLVMRLVEDYHKKLFLSKSVELVELSSNDYIINDTQSGMNCLDNTPEHVGERSEIRGISNVSNDGLMITCEYIIWKDKRYSNYTEHLHCTEKVSLSIDIQNVMLEQQTLEWLLDNFQRQKKVERARQNKLSMQQQREEALITYLITCTLDQENLELQARYERIGEPDKDRLWTQLQKVAPKLFSAGKDDFFKAPFFTPGLPQFKLELRKKPIGRPPKA